MVDYSPPDFSVYGIFQARILEWVAIYYSRNLPDSGIKPVSPALAARFFITEPPGKPLTHKTIPLKSALIQSGLLCIKRKR